MYSLGSFPTTLVDFLASPPLCQELPESRDTLSAKSTAQDRQLRNTF